MSSWADPYIEQLARGETVEIRLTVKSASAKAMEPMIPVGATCFVQPVQEQPSATYNVTQVAGLRLGDIVLATTSINTWLHRIGAITIVGNTTWYRIENAAGRINGWTTSDKIHGHLVRVDAQPGV
jgi:hypothetical protein